MRTRPIAAVAGALAVPLGIAVFAAPGVGREGAGVTAHTATAGHAAPAARAATHDRRTTGPDYREYASTIEPHKERGATLTCPRSAPYAVGGYFGSSSKAARGKLVMTNSNPVGTTGRKWDVGIYSAADRRVRFFVGVTCMRKGDGR